MMDHIVKILHFLGFEGDLIRGSRRWLGLNPFDQRDSADLQNYCAFALGCNERL